MSKSCCRRNLGNPAGTQFPPPTPKKTNTALKVIGLAALVGILAAKK